MRTGSLLSAIAAGAVLSVAAGARAAEPEVDATVQPPIARPTLAALVDRAWHWVCPETCLRQSRGPDAMSEPWSAEAPDLSRWFADLVPSVDALLDPSTWSTRWLVTVRDVLGDTADYSRSLLALLPAPELPDLTILSASPVPGVESSGFGWRRDPIHHRDKFHKGTDFRADRGTPVYSAGAGVVAFTGRQSGYGKVIYVDHGGGVVTRYAHLSSIEVKAGTAVPAARLIGKVGATGRATGPHLHFEVRLAGRAVDPELAMQVGALQRTDPAAARWMGWLLSPRAQDERIDRHDPPRRAPARAGSRPERRHAPVRDRNRS